MDYDIEAEVERLFNEAPDRFEKHRENPITHGRWMADLDPIAPQKRAAARALRAGRRFAQDNPDLPALPLNHSDRESMKRGGVSHIIAWYARSLEACKYEYDVHPSFYDYACGVMASEFNGYPNVKLDHELLAKYPPRPLPGLGPGLCWKPAKRSARNSRAYLRS